MIPEKEYADYLEIIFKDHFGPDNVEREFYTESGRFCDFYIKTELVDLAVEVENKTEDVITNGVAQVLLYAQELDAIPVVVHPPDSKDNETELTQLSAFCEIIEIPYKL